MKPGRNSQVSDAAGASIAGATDSPNRATQRRNQIAVVYRDSTRTSAIGPRPVAGAGLVVAVVRIAGRGVVGLALTGVPRAPYRAHT